MLAAACSPAPHPGFGNSVLVGETQPIISGVVHWRALAESTAASVAECIDGGWDARCGVEASVLANRPVFISDTEYASPFGRVFDDFLILSLLDRGVAITDRREGAVVVSTVAHLVARDGKLPSGDFPGPASALAGGLALVDYTTVGLVALGGAVDYWQSRNAFGNGTQLVVASSLSVEGRPVMRRIRAFYVPETDRRQYASSSPWRPSGAAGASSSESLPLATFKMVDE